MIIKTGQDIHLSTTCLAVCLSGKFPSQLPGLAMTLKLGREVR